MLNNAPEWKCGMKAAAAEARSAVAYTAGEPTTGAAARYHPGCAVGSIRVRIRAGRRDRRWARDRLRVAFARAGARPGARSRMKRSLLSILLVAGVASARP